MTETEQVQTNEQEVNKIENPPEQIQESEEQINWKKFREQRKIERQQKDEALRIAKQKEAEAEALKAAMESILNKNTPVHQESNEEMSEDQKIEMKVQQALINREKQLEQQRKQYEVQDLPRKLNESYSDFNNVCSTENLDYLEFHYPEIAKIFGKQDDSFEKWSSIYQTVKKLIPNSANNKEKIKAEKNLNKPQSMSVAGITQTGDTTPVRILDESKKKANWERMQKAMRGI